MRELDESILRIEGYIKQGHGHIKQGQGHTLIFLQIFWDVFLIIL